MSDCDAVYTERDQCVALLARMAVAMGWEAWIGPHEGDGEWDDEWLNVVFIQLPSGQASWHIHERELPWFGFLWHFRDAAEMQSAGRGWDGHTVEEKYRRVMNAVNQYQLPLYDPKRRASYESNRGVS